MWPGRPTNAACPDSGQRACNCASRAVKRLDHNSARGGPQGAPRTRSRLRLSSSIRRVPSAPFYRRQPVNVSDLKVVRDPQYAPPVGREVSRRHSREVKDESLAGCRRRGIDESRSGILVRLERLRLAARAGVRMDASADLVGLHDCDCHVCCHVHLRRPDAGRARSSIVCVSRRRAGLPRLLSRQFHDLAGISLPDLRGRRRG